jgi:hypothetical protein
MDARVVDGWVALVREPRDRKALPPFLPDDITRMQVRTPDDVFVLARRSAVDWKVVSSQRVDSTFAIATGAVDGLLAELATLEAAGWPERQPAPASYDPPSIQVLLFAGERAVSGLDVGTRDRSGINLFARAPGEPAVFWLSPADLLKLPFDLERFKAEGQAAPEGTDRG